MLENTQSYTFFVAENSALSPYTLNVHSTLYELQTDGSHVFYVTFMKL